MLRNIDLLPNLQCSLSLKCDLEKCYFTNYRGHDLLPRNPVVNVLGDLDPQGHTRPEALGTCSTFWTSVPIWSH